MKKINILGFSTVGVLAILLLVSFFTAQTVSAAITSQLGLGSKGSQVTELQQFLATNNSIYPQGIVSGYYGALTKDAVTQFQVNYGISQVGTVGPITASKINDIMLSGFGLDINAPSISNINIQSGRNSATISWSTNESARGQLYYDATMIQSNESSFRGDQAYVSGVLAPNNSGVSYSQSITIQNLQPNTVYYYLIRAVDNSGNITLVLPRAFQTSN
ncbi:MAG: peptidoglycan-binding protein [Candidatus Paceibacterota bacterium]|jgi:peptidoglycan hydrolase-like protein with peptidoglycan-binding domain